MSHHHHLLRRRGCTITVESPNGSSRTITPNITMSPRARELRQNVLDHVENHHRTFHQTRQQALIHGDPSVVSTTITSSPPSDSSLVLPSSLTVPTATAASTKNSPELMPASIRTSPHGRSNHHPNHAYIVNSHHRPHHHPHPHPSNPSHPPSTSMTSQLGDYNLESKSDDSISRSFLRSSPIPQTPISQHRTSLKSIVQKNQVDARIHHSPIGDVLSHTDINNIEYGKFSFDGLSLEDRKKKEMALILCVEQAQVILHRFRVLVPFLQKMDHILSRTAPNIGRAFYKWHMESEIKKRITMAMERQDNHMFDGLNLLDNMMNDKLQMYVCKRFMKWKIITKRYTSELSQMFKIFYVHWKHEKRKYINLWYRNVKSIILQEQYIQQSISSTNDNNALGALRHEYNQQVLHDVKGKRRKCLKVLMRKKKDRKLTKALMVWTEYLLKMKSTSKLVRIFAKITKHAVHRSFKQWSQQSKHEINFMKSKNKQLKKIMKRYKFNYLLQALQRWNERIAKNKRYNSIGQYIQRQHGRRKTTQSFHQWRMYIQKILYIKMKLKYVVSTYEYALLHAAMIRWNLSTKLIQRNEMKKKLLTRILLRNNKTNMKSIFTYWLWGSKMETEREEISAMLVRQWTQLGVARHFRAWLELHTKMLRVKKNRVQADSLYSLLLYNRCVRRWKRGTALRKHLKTFVSNRIKLYTLTHLYHGMNVWKKWVLYVQIMSVTEKSNHMKMVHIIHRIHKRALRSLFFKWKTIGVIKRRLQRFTKKILYMQAVASLHRWYEFSRKRIWLRRYLHRILNHQRFALLFHGMRKWKDIHAASIANDLRQFHEKTMLTKQQKFSKNILLRIIHRSLHVKFMRWKEKYYDQKKFKYCALKILCRKKAQWFHKWIDQIKTMHRQRGLIKRALSRVTNALLHRCVDNWCDDVDTRKRLRKRMLVSMKRWSVAKLRIGMRKWLEHCGNHRKNEEEGSRQLQVAKRILGRMVHRQMAFMFDQWLTHLSEKRRLRRFMLRVKNSQLHAWFDRWLEQIKTMHRQRSLIKRALSRVTNALLHRCVDNWENFVNNRQRLRKRMLVLLQRWSVAQLHWGMKRLHLHYEQQRSDAADKERQHRSARRAAARMLHQRLGQLFDRWVGWFRRQRGMRSFLSRWFNAEKNKVFNTWYEHVQIQIRHRQLVKKCLARSKNVKLYGYYDQWVEKIEQRKRLKSRVLVAFQRWSLAQYQWGMHRWHLFVKQHQNEQHTETRRMQVQRRIISKILHRTLSKYFDTWCYQTTFKIKMKQMMVRLLHATKYRTLQTWKSTIDERVQHRRVVRHFVYKMLNLKKVKCWTQWINFMDVRVHLRRRLCVCLQRWKVASFTFGFQRLTAHVQRERENDRMLQKQYSRTKRIMARRLHRTLSIYYEKWIEYVSEQRRLRRFIIKLAASTLYNSFHRWSERVTTMKREKHITQKCLQRAMKMKLSKCWCTWYDLLQSCQWLKAFVKRRLYLWATSKLRKGFVTWHRYVRRLTQHQGKRSREQQMCQQIIRRMLHRQKSMYYQRWRCKVHEIKRLVRFVLRMQHTKLSACYQRWCENVQVVNVQRDKVARIVSKLMKKALHECMDRWVEYVNERDLVRTRMVIVMKRWILLQLTHGMDTWKQYLQAILSHEKESANKNRRIRMFMTRIMYRTQSKIMSSWKKKIVERNRLRQYLKRIKHVQLHKWFTLLFQKTCDLKHKRQQVQKILRRVLHQDLARCYLKWCALVHVRKRLRQSLSIAVGRWKIMKLRYGFMHWLKNSMKLHEYVKEEKRRQHHGYYLLLRMLHHEKVRVWTTWKDRIVEIRRMRRFLLRMKNSTLVKRFVLWKQQIQLLKDRRRQFAMLLSKSSITALEVRFEQWYQKIQVRLHLRKRMTLTVQRWTITKLTNSLKKWKRNIHEMKRQEISTRQHHEHMDSTMYRMFYIIDQYWCKKGFHRWVKAASHTKYIQQQQDIQRQHFEKIQTMTVSMKQQHVEMASQYTKLQQHVATVHMQRTHTITQRHLLHSMLMRWYKKIQHSKHSKTKNNYNDDNLHLMKAFYLDRVMNGLMKDYHNAMNYSFQHWKSMQMHIKIREKMRGTLFCLHARRIQLQKFIKNQQLHASFKQWYNYLLIQNHVLDQRKSAQRHLQRLRHLGRVILRCDHHQWTKRMSISFRRWSHWVSNLRDIEWRERLSKMRAVVYQHTKQSESQLVNVVKQRLDMWERKRNEDERKQ